MKSEAVPGIGVILFFFAIAGLEVLAWNPAALCAMFGLIIFIFGGLLLSNLRSTAKVNRAADAIAYEQLRKQRKREKRERKARKAKRAKRAQEREEG